MKILRYFLAVLILMFAVQPSKAVLKGDDINETVIMLNSELEVFSVYVDATARNFIVARNDYRKKMADFRNDLASARLSLFSQQGQYIFGNAYASENARMACAQFYSNQLPIEMWQTTYQRAVMRCRELQKTLEQIDSTSLTPQAQTSRAQGLVRLNSTLANLGSWRDSVIVDMEQYAQLASQVKAFENDIDKNYEYIFYSLLLMPDKQPTHKVYSTDFPAHWTACKNTLNAMLTSSSYYGWEFQEKWTAQFYLLLFSALISFAIGFLLGLFALRRYVGRRWAKARNHPYIFGSFCGWVLVALIYFVVKVAVVTNPFFISALNLGIEMCMMLIFLNCSMMLRVDTRQLVPTLLSYMPTVLLSLSIIIYRVSLVDINVIRVTYPILLALLIVAQVVAISRLMRNIPVVDRYVSVGALVLFAICFAMNFWGYYYLSIHIALAWSLYIIGFLLLSCFYYILRRRENQLRQRDEKAFLASWRPFTYKRLLRPMALIIVFIVCTLECAHVFNINDWLNGIYKYDFVHYPGIVCLSVKRVFRIALFAILVHYMVGLVNYILRRQYKEKADVGALNLVRNVMVIVVWGAFVVVALAYVEVNSIGIIATLGGLAVGLGVALRDTFDCLLCGIILMMGRIKIGDVVEVGSEVRGKVVDIQYRTTLIETDDGAIISVFNTQFFGKDFRNVSYSGKYQRLHIAFRVQKEIDSPHIRKVLAQALIDNVPELAKTPAPRILFGGTDRFHVDMIAQVWVPVMDYYEAISNVKETLFNTLKANGMSNMSVDTRVRVIKNMIEEPDNNKQDK